MFLMIFMAVTAGLVAFSLWYDEKEKQYVEFMIKRYEEKEELERKREEFIRSLY